MREGFGQTLPHQCSDFIGRHAIVRAVLAMRLRGSRSCSDKPNRRNSNHYCHKRLRIQNDSLLPIRNGLIECRYFSIIFLYGQIDEDARRIQPFRTVVSVRSCFNNDVVTVLPYVNGVVVDVLVGIGLVFTTTCIITVDYGASVAAYRVKQFIGISQITRNVVSALTVELKE